MLYIFVHEYIYSIIWVVKEHFTWLSARLTSIYLHGEKSIFICNKQEYRGYVVHYLLMNIYIYTYVY